VEIAMRLGALPLLRELRELAGRALIALPPEVEERLTMVDDRPPAQVSPGAGHGSPVPVASGVNRTATGLGQGSDGVHPTLVLDLADQAEPSRKDTFGLSGREREVLTQIVSGRTNREIGERLFISQKTVGVHVGNILAKLGVSGRVEAAAVAIRLGLTERA
jgi:DNA-binding CsgD family transcriptional regulator